MVQPSHSPRPNSCSTILVRWQESQQCQRRRRRMRPELAEDLLVNSHRHFQARHHRALAQLFFFAVRYSRTRKRSSMSYYTHLFPFPPFIPLSFSFVLSDHAWSWRKEGWTPHVLRLSKSEGYGMGATWNFATFGILSVEFNGNLSLWLLALIARYRRPAPN